jgi:ribonuclease E
MTRKRIGTGLLEAFTETCTCCQGRGFHVLSEPVLPDPGVEEDATPRGRDSGRSRGGRSSAGRSRSDDSGEALPPVRTPALDPRLRPKPHPPEPTPETGESAAAGAPTDVTVATVAGSHDEPDGSDPHDVAVDKPEDATTALPETALPETAAAETTAVETTAVETAAPDTTAAETAPAEPAADESTPTESAPAETPEKPKRVRRSRAKLTAEKPVVEGSVEVLSTEPPADG